MLNPAEYAQFVNRLVRHRISGNILTALNTRKAGPDKIDGLTVEISGVDLNRVLSELERLQAKELHPPSLVPADDGKISV